MKTSACPLKGLMLVELPIYKDERGFFVERFQIEKFKNLGLPASFVQDNHSFSVPGVVRGLHCQYMPAQGKLVGVIRGRIWDVAVDVRPSSPTYGQHFAVELSAENGKLLWIPGGFAHGFCVLGDEPADVFYKVDNLYNPKTEMGIKWDDPELALPWPVKQPIVSQKDQQLMSFAEYKKNPPAWE